MRRSARGALAVVVLAALAAPAAAEHGMSGFVMEHAGELRGRVVDLDGQPMRGVKVHIVQKGVAEKIVKTDAEGRYRATLTSGALVYVEEAARIQGQTAVSGKDGGGESVEMHEVLPAKTVAHSISDARTIPPYSEEAKDRNDWRKAWMLLDVDATGTVQRQQMLQAPGLGLDDIAVREAWKLRFEPARDLADRPMASLVIWSFEWPAFWWLGMHESRTLVPGDSNSLVCRGAGPSEKVYRDCSEPDLSKSATKPWLVRPKTPK